MHTSITVHPQTEGETRTTLDFKTGPNARWATLVIGGHKGVELTVFFDNAEQEMAFRKALIDQLFPDAPIIAPDDDGLDHTGSPRNELPDDEPEPDKNRDQLTDPPLPGTFVFERNG